MVPPIARRLASSSAARRRVEAASPLRSSAKHEPTRSTLVWNHCGVIVVSWSAVFVSVMRASFGAPPGPFCQQAQHQRSDTVPIVVLLHVGAASLRQPPRAALAGERVPEAIEEPLARGLEDNGPPRSFQPDDTLGRRRHGAPASHRLYHLVLSAGREAQRR